MHICHSSKRTEALQAQDLVEYELNDTYKFKGYVKAYSMGALGIFYRNNKIWVVRVLYHPSEYGVAVEYKVPGWMPIEDYLKNKSNEICLEYVYLELMNRLRLHLLVFFGAQFAFKMFISLLCCVIRVLVDTNFPGSNQHWEEFPASF